MSGFGSCCCDETCLPIGTPPTITIEGMHVIEEWSSDECCKTIVFEYDDPQTPVRLDGGDVFNYDEQSQCVVETFYFPLTCGDVLQSEYIEDPPTSGNFVLYVPPEPTYTGCCADAVVLNTLTTDFRRQGGQRFLVEVTPVRIWVKLQKTNIDCGAGSSVKFIVTSGVVYEGFTTYYNYELTTNDYTYTDTNATCWNILTDTSVGALFDFGTWDGSVSGVPPGYPLYQGGGFEIPVSFEICRQKQYTTLPTGAVAFVDGDCLDTCTIEIPCFECDCSQPCFDSGPTGPSAINPTFCDVTTYGTNTVNLTIKTCRQAFWRYPPPNDTTCEAYTGWNSLTPCTKTYSWTIVENSQGLGCPCPGKKSTAPDSCWPSISCERCTGGPDEIIYQPPGSGVIFGETDPPCRTTSMSRTISCSGYTQQNVCLPFVGWSMEFA